LFVPALSQIPLVFLIKKLPAAKTVQGGIYRNRLLSVNPEFRQQVLLLFLFDKDGNRPNAPGNSAEYEQYAGKTAAAAISAVIAVSLAHKSNIPPHSPFPKFLIMLSYPPFFAKFRTGTGVDIRRELC